MPKGLLSYGGFLFSGFVIVLGTLAWRVFGEDPNERIRGLREDEAYELVFSLVFVLVGSVGFMSYLLIRRKLIGALLPGNALLLSLVSALPPFVLLELGAVGAVAERVEGVGLPLPVPLTIWPIFILLSALSAAVVFGLADRRKHSVGYKNG